MFFTIASLSRALSLSLWPFCDFYLFKKYIYFLHLLYCVSGRLLVLDEMDQLDSKAQDVLYTIFEWPYLPKSRLCLIGESYIMWFPYEGTRNAFLCAALIIDSPATNIFICYKVQQSIN